MARRRLLGLVLGPPLALVLAFLAYEGLMSSTVTLPPAGAQVVIPLGSGTDLALRRLTAAGVIRYPWLLRLAMHLHGGAGIQAGLYEFKGAVSTREVLGRLLRGESTPLYVTIIPGWRLSQVMGALQRAPYLDVRGLPLAGKADSMLPRLGVGQSTAEGWLYPDSYRYVPGTPALEVLRRAYTRMEQTLDRMWRERAPGLPLDNPDQALVLASIVEKEGAPPDQQAHIAGIFYNRLRLGMPLQSDPTVIYALGPAYQGTLQPSDMRDPSPFNTYVHQGLPPAPIAMPGRGAIRAVLHPLATDDLYFIAKGDVYRFSRSYTGHVQQIDSYLKKTPKKGVKEGGHGGTAH